MHHQTDSLHDSDYFQIFPTVIGMYNLSGYHPAEEPKVISMTAKSDIEFNSEKDFLDENNLLLLKQNINDCIKAYSNEYGVDYYEIKHSWYERISSTTDGRKYPNDTFVGYYFPKVPFNSAGLIVDPPFKSPIQKPSEKSVSIYTAPNEKFIINSGHLIITPAYLNRYFTVNESNTIDMIVFTVKLCR